MSALQGVGPVGQEPAWRRSTVELTVVSGEAGWCTSCAVRMRPPLGVRQLTLLDPTLALSGGTGVLGIGDLHGAVSQAGASASSPASSPTVVVQVPAAGGVTTMLASPHAHLGGAARTYLLGGAQPTPDLIAVLDSGTASGYVELHVLAAGDNWRSIALRHVTGVQEEDGALNFRWSAGAMGPAGPDLVGLKTSSTSTGHMELHVLSAASCYRTYNCQTVVATRQGGADALTWVAFTGLDGRIDLIGASRSGRGGRLRVTRLLAAELWVREHVTEVDLGSAAPSKLLGAVARVGGLPDLILQH